MSVKSKRLAEVQLGNLPEGTHFCRVCQEVKRRDQFHRAIDFSVDVSGFFSMCKDCSERIFLKHLTSEKSIQMAIYKMCKSFNVLYQEESIESALKQIETRNWDKDKLWGVYLSKLIVFNRTTTTDDATTLDLTFRDNPTVNSTKFDISEEDVENDVVRYWGKGYEEDDYRWLEDQLAEWKKTHKCDNKAEETLLREIVIKQHDIEKAREDSKPTDGLIKGLQDLMKTASVDPAKSNIASSGKSQDTFSAFIKMIEEDEPAEVFGDERDAFKDFQGIEKYFEKYIVRPLKNFITMSRDFNVDSDDADNENEFDKFEDYLPEIPEIDVEDIKKLEE